MQRSKHGKITEFEIILFGKQLVGNKKRYCYTNNKKCKAIPVTGRGGP
jgi:hypothetical protein